MNDSLRGQDLNGALLWTAEKINDQWLGSGRDLSGLVRSPDLRAALQFYLSRYPETDEIQAQLGGQYRMCMPGQAAMSIIDAVLKELGCETG